MTLPACYRCGDQPCTCKDGIALYHGDCLEVMAGMEAGSVQTCVTSPPYWGLRDYGVDGQLGLEATPEEYVVKIVKVFREVRRVLRDDGTLWLNLGDTYTSGGRGEWRSGVSDNKGHRVLDNAKHRPLMPVNLKPKDLIGIPWRVAFALQADGWYLRQDIIWHKPNPMPESVTDRCTKAHEYLFLLSKSPRYFYDANAIRESSTGQNGQAANFARDTKDCVVPNQSVAQHRLDRAVTEDIGFRNKRSVWTIAAKPYKGAHFATFPPDLVEPCIKAGTSEEGCCPECGTPWVRVVEKEAMKIRRSKRGNALGEYGRTATSGTMVKPASSKTTGWRPGCECRVPCEAPEPFGPIPCTVLDPFLGSGTTAAVARKNSCRCVGIELNAEYLSLAANRLKQGVLF